MQDETRPRSLLLQLVKDMRERMGNTQPPHPLIQEEMRKRPVIQMEKIRRDMLHYDDELINYISKMYETTSNGEYTISQETVEFYRKLNSMVNNDDVMCYEKYKDIINAACSDKWITPYNFHLLEMDTYIEIYDEGGLFTIMMPGLDSYQIDLYIPDDELARVAPHINAATSTIDIRTWFRLVDWHHSVVDILY